jgi:hypothetical protein
MLRKSIAALFVAVALSVSVGAASAAAEPPDMMYDGVHPGMLYD